MPKIIVAIFISFALLGCNSLPEKLQIADKVELLPFDEVGDMDLEPTNVQALWGGVIAKTANFTDRTQIEIIYFPLNDQGRPQINQESLGRFRIYVGDFIDPFVYRPGRMVTVLGTLGLREKGYVGHYPYDYTVLHSLELHLWTDKRPLPMPPQIEQYLQSPPTFSYQ